MKRLLAAFSVVAALWSSACSSGNSIVNPPPPVGKYSLASLKGQYAFVTNGESFTGGLSATPLARNNQSGSSNHRWQLYGQCRRPWNVNSPTCSGLPQFWDHANLDERWTHDRRDFEHQPIFHGKREFRQTKRRFVSGFGNCWTLYFRFSWAGCKQQSGVFHR